MTWTPETNRIPCSLLTDAEWASLEAAQHGWDVCYVLSGQWGEYKLTAGHRKSDLVVRAKFAPEPLHPEYLRGIDDLAAALKLVRGPRGEPPVLPVMQPALYSFVKDAQVTMEALRAGVFK